MTVFRPLAQSGGPRPEGAVSLAGGWTWFTHAEGLERGRSLGIVPVEDIPSDDLERLSRPRAPIARLEMDRPRLMGILNITPDSFSDGGRHFDPTDALTASRDMVEAGAEILDIGGESTRPGAMLVPEDEEIRRILPVVGAIRSELNVPLSIDTRKSAVAEVALAAGAHLVNDVSGLTFDEELAPLCIQMRVPVCIMHAQGDPMTMQADPRYDDVVLDVYDYLAERVNALVEIGMPHDQIVIDPGIGFGKTVEHNLTLLRSLSVFHGLGCPILLGVSRKRFIGVIGDAPKAADRMPGSIAVGLAALAQGVQILRAHDVGPTAQAMRLWSAVR